MEDYWKSRASLKSSTTQAAQAANHVPTNALNQSHRNPGQMSQPYLAQEVCVIERTIRQDPMTLNSCSSAGLQGLGTSKLMSDLFAIVSGKQQHVGLPSYPPSVTSQSTGIPSCPQLSTVNSTTPEGLLAWPAITPSSLHSGSPLSGGSRSSSGVTAHASQSGQVQELSVSTSDSLVTGAHENASFGFGPLPDVLKKTIIFDRPHEQRVRTSQQNPPPQWLTETVSRQQQIQSMVTSLPMLVGNSALQKIPQTTSNLPSARANHPQPASNPAPTGRPLVFCANFAGSILSGELCLTVAGRLGVVCACHNVHMSVTKFTQHAGIYTGNPGEAVFMQGGHTLVKWRKLFFHQYGVKLPEDHLGWDWVDLDSLEAGKANPASITQCSSKDFDGSSGGKPSAAKSKTNVWGPCVAAGNSSVLHGSQTAFTSKHSMAQVSCGQGVLHKQQENLSKNLGRELRPATTYVEFESGHFIPDPAQQGLSRNQATAGGLNSLHNTAKSAQIAMNEYHTFISDGGRQYLSSGQQVSAGGSNIKQLNYPRNNWNDGNDNRLKEKDNTSSSVELRLGQPSQYTQPTGSSSSSMLSASSIEHQKSLFSEHIMQRAWDVKTQQNMQNLLAGGLPKMSGNLECAREQLQKISKTQSQYEGIGNMQSTCMEGLGGQRHQSGITSAFLQSGSHLVSVPMYHAANLNASMHHSNQNLSCDQQTNKVANRVLYEQAGTDKSVMQCALQTDQLRKCMTVGNGRPLESQSLGALAQINNRAGNELLEKAIQASMRHRSSGMDFSSVVGKRKIMPAGPSDCHMKSLFHSQVPSSTTGNDIKADPDSSSKGLQYSGSAKQLQQVPTSAVILRNQEPPLVDDLHLQKIYFKNSVTNEEVRGRDLALVHLEGLQSRAESLGDNGRKDRQQLQVIINKQDWVQRPLKVESDLNSKSPKVVESDLNSTSPEVAFVQNSGLSNGQCGRSDGKASDADCEGLQSRAESLGDNGRKHQQQQQVIINKQDWVQRALQVESDLNSKGPKVVSLQNSGLSDGQCGKSDGKASNADCEGLQSRAESLGDNGRKHQQQQQVIINKQDWVQRALQVESDLNSKGPKVVSLQNSGLSDGQCGKSDGKASNADCEGLQSRAESLGDNGKKDQQQQQVIINKQDWIQRPLNMESDLKPKSPKVVSLQNTSGLSDSQCGRSHGKANGADCDPQPHAETKHMGENSCGQGHKPLSGGAPSMMEVEDIRCNCFKCQKSSSTPRAQAVTRIAGQICLKEKGCQGISTKTADKDIEIGDVQKCPSSEKQQSELLEHRTAIVPAKSGNGEKSRDSHGQPLFSKVANRTWKELTDDVLSENAAKGTVAGANSRREPNECSETCSKSSENVMSGLSDEGQGNDEEDRAFQGQFLSKPLGQNGVCDKASATHKSHSSDSDNMGAGINPVSRAGDLTKPESPSSLQCPSSSNVAKKLVIKTDASSSRGKQQSVKEAEEKNDKSKIQNLEQKRQVNLKWKRVGSDGDAGEFKKRKTSISCDYSVEQTHRVQDTDLGDENQRVNVLPEVSAEEAENLCESTAGKEKRLKCKRVLVGNCSPSCISVAEVKGTEETIRTAEEEGPTPERKNRTLIIQVPQQISHEEATGPIHTTCDLSEALMESAVDGSDDLLSSVERKKLGEGPFVRNSSSRKGFLEKRRSESPLAVSRGISPPKAAGSIETKGNIGSQKGFLEKRRSESPLAVSRAISPPKAAGSIETKGNIGIQKGFLEKRSSGSPIAVSRPVSSPKTAGSIVTKGNIGSQKGFLEKRSSGSPIAVSRPVSSPKTAGSIVTKGNIGSQKGILEKRGSGSPIAVSRPVSPPKAAGNIVTSGNIGSQKGILEKRGSGSPIAVSRPVSPPKAAGSIVTSGNIGSQKGILEKRSSVSPIAVSRPVSPPKATGSIVTNGNINSQKGSLEKRRSGSPTAVSTPGSPPKAAGSIVTSGNIGSQKGILEKRSSVSPIAVSRPVSPPKATGSIVTNGNINSQKGSLEKRRSGSPTAVSTPGSPPKAAESIVTKKMRSIRGGIESPNPRNRRIVSLSNILKRRAERIDPQYRAVLKQVSAAEVEEGSHKRLKSNSCATATSPKDTKDRTESSSSGNGPLLDSSTLSLSQKDESPKVRSLFELTSKKTLARPDLEVSDTTDNCVELSAACNHDITTVQTKFSLPFPCPFSQSPCPVPRSGRSVRSNPLSKRSFQCHRSKDAQADVGESNAALQEKRLSQTKVDCCGEADVTQLLQPQEACTHRSKDTQADVGKRSAALQEKRLSQTKVDRCREAGVTRLLQPQATSAHRSKDAQADVGKRSAALHEKRLSQTKVDHCREADVKQLLQPQETCTRRSKDAQADVVKRSAALQEKRLSQTKVDHCRETDVKWLSQPQVTSTHRSKDAQADVGKRSTALQEKRLSQSKVEHCREADVKQLQPQETSTHRSKDAQSDVGKRSAALQEKRLSQTKVDHCREADVKQLLQPQETCTHRSKDAQSDVDKRSAALQEKRLSQSKVDRCREADVESLQLQETSTHRSKDAQSDVGKRSAALQEKRLPQTKVDRCGEADVKRLLPPLETCTPVSRSNSCEEEIFKITPLSKKPRSIKVGAKAPNVRDIPAMARDVRPVQVSALCDARVGSEIRANMVPSKVNSTLKKRVHVPTKLQGSPVRRLKTIGQRIREQECGTL
ncbi:unnamed protein product [Sphagnum balticum]